MAAENDGIVGWGLIGASTIAREWVIGAIRETGGRPAIVMSRDKARAENYARANDVGRATDSLDVMLSDKDVAAVYISTTNERHYDEAMAAAAAGKHVLCEKPLALTIGQAEAMVGACRDRGLVFATNHHIRNAASIRKIRDLVQGAAIGAVHAMRIFHAVYLPEHLQSWRLDRPDCGGGIALDISVHDGDTARFILDEEPVEVAAMGGSYGLASQGLDDSVMYVMRMRSGTLVQVHESFVTRYAGTGLEVHGAEGSIIARDVMTQRPVGTVRLRRTNSDEEIPVEHENLYVRALGRFHAAIRGEDLPAADGIDGIRSLSIALAVEEAARTGRVTKVATAGLQS